MSRARRWLRDSRGFSMAEMMVALVVFAIAIGGVYAVLVTQASSSRLTNYFIQAQENARYGMERMMEEARWSDQVCAATGGATPSVTFDIPAGNPLTPTQSYEVKYQLSGTATLQRTLTNTTSACTTTGGATTDDLASNVTGLTLTFLDNAVPTPNVLDIVNNPGEASSVYRVSVGLTVSVGTQFRSFNSDVFLRNHP